MPAFSEADAFRKAWRAQELAADEGFDWPDAHGVLEKITEETGEIREAIEAHDTEHAARELGDLLLATVNLARALQADPAKSLNEAVERFCTRYEKVRARVHAQGKTCSACTLEELDTHWNAVKALADLEVQQSA